MSGAVIVTTPQKLAFVDVVKGLEMFLSLKVPTMCVVENMAWFDGADGTRYTPFGRGHDAALREGYGLAESFQLPILAALSESGDSGTPFFAAHPASAAADVYRALADCVSRQAERGGGSRGAEPAHSLRYIKERNVLLLQVIAGSSAESFEIAPHELRKRMRKVEDMLKLGVADELVYPLAIQPMGNYAVSIKWSDGHDATIYPYRDIRQVCAGDAPK
jgi:DUF971 family protein